ESYRAAASAEPGSAVPRAKLCRLYVDRRCWDTALRECELAIDAEPDSPEGYTAMARLWLLRRDYEKAQHYYELAAQREPDAASAHNNVGWAQLVRGQNPIESALDELGLAETLLPTQLEIASSVFDSLGW